MSQRPQSGSRYLLVAQKHVCLTDSSSVHRTERKTDELVAIIHQLRDFTHSLIMDSSGFCLFRRHSDNTGLSWFVLIVNLTHLSEYQQSRNGDKQTFRVSLTT